MRARQRQCEEKKNRFEKNLFVTRSCFLFFTLHMHKIRCIFRAYTRRVQHSVAVALCGRVLAVESVEHVFNDEAKIK